MLFDVVALLDEDTSDLDHWVKETASTVVAMTRPLRPDLGALALEHGAEAVVAVERDGRGDRRESRSVPLPALSTTARSPRRPSTTPGSATRSGLSPRETDVLRLVVLGFSNQRDRRRAVRQRELRQDLHPQRLPQDRRDHAAPGRSRGVSATASPRPTTDAAPVRLGIVTLPVTLLDLPTDELTATARGVRDASTGTRVTYSPKVFVPLTRLCRDRCGYCTFATAPHHIASPFLSPDEVLAVASAGAEAGCHEVLFTLGEAPEDRYVEARDWLAAHGYASTVDYLVTVAGRVLEETGLLPHANAGAVSREDLARLRTRRAVAGDDDRVAAW